MNEPAGTTTTQSFEAHLAPVLEVAFGVAYHLSRSRDDAEDLVQDAALQAYRAYHQFQPGTNFKAWFMKILTNAFFAKRRTAKRRPQTMSLEDAAPLTMLFEATAAGLGAVSSDPAGEIIGRLGEERVGEAIGELPDEFRVVCALYFMQDVSYQEIADMLDLPVGTVRSRLHRGRRMLQAALWQLAREHGIAAEMLSEKVDT